MEIISYLDNRQVSHRSPSRPFGSFNRTTKQTAYGCRPFSPSYAETGTSCDAAVFVRIGCTAARTLKRISRYARPLLFIGALSACGFAITAAFYELNAYVQSFARPVHLAYLSPNEIEVLDNAMERFALVSSDEIDTAGNLLNGGKAISIADINLSQPVTYTSYTVKSGDTISGITRKFGLTNISTLIAANDIHNVRLLRSGQKLRIPSIDGLIYTVKANETIEGVSLRNNIAVEDILDVNDLSSAALQVGQQLFIPGARLDTTTLKKAMGELFIYPLNGNWRLTSKFGFRPDPFTGVKSTHTGIDMAIAQGTPIKAAMSGKIIAAGYTNVYGNYVIIDHENGYQTLYGHMQKPSPLKKGQRVGQGTQIGLVGNTGYSTGAHLHFTVYKNGKLIDPLTVLK
ncbi:M23 family metallopeptidase [Treponema brennaborense]|uniref:Peptidase M23 n=1 Tax=Treponema brennaborense (strain DSM 12168 / CIP 105900 / DD5/3) TaxID=906968 RepID=F4LJB2_TREBD|nr:M23 family metallopeptidase [Treponema brennaborense]AEE17357.1 Peptidase M23 [Treponema brennaborense DSM 12168]